MDIRRNGQILFAAAALLAASALGIERAAAADCTIKLGVVLPVSGPMGLVGERIAETGQFAVDVYNEAGGVKGCKVEYLLRDTQGQSTVGVDAAKSLVDIEGVPVLVGAISSGVSLPILTSVAVPSKVTQISCCSSSESFTALAEEGKTEGYWFRTYATNRSQAAMGALLTTSKGYGKTAVIYVNTDFGVGLAKRYEQDIAELGGSITKMVAYNESQQSYRAEVTSAMEGDFPIRCSWSPSPSTGPRSPANGFRSGGTGNLVVNNSLRSSDYLEAVGSKHLTGLVGYDSAQPRTESVASFNSMFEARFGGPPDGPGLHSMFDAVTVVLLAMEAAGEIDGTSVRDNIRMVTEVGGEPVHPGPEGIGKAKELIAAGKSIRYVGATGPLQFDENGDVQAPKLTWRFEGDRNVEMDYYSIEDVADLIMKLDN